jgi:hypothetical protein
VDQARDHAAGPGAGVHVALDHDLGIDAGDFLDDVLELDVGAQLLLLLEQAFDAGIGQHALGVAQRAHDQAGVQLAGRDDGVLHVLVDRGFLGGDEAGAHVHAVGAHGQGGDQLRAVGHAAGGDERDLQLLGGARQQDEVGRRRPRPGGRRTRSRRR